MTDAEHEVIRLHQVIEGWLTGAADRADFGPFAGALAPDFTLVGPDGVAMAQKEVLAWVEGSHGSAPDLRITIRDVRVVADSGDLVVATYEEWHGTAPGAPAPPPDARGRRATVVFRRGAGLDWLHLHETWVAAPPSAGTG
ncbi:nuclear transport factor 2 family protein [Nonomuraea sp. B5E05]|uniref:nuclear transport factor 2 family protein n=1 Tax=Nonomuraea sp. B5E05 TaxID=3153569 RepID=UPI0032612508